MIDWATAAPAVTATFLASIVEVVEAFTIILAVATVLSRKPALLGPAAGLALLAVLVLALGPLLERIPLQVLQLVIGVLLAAVRPAVATQGDAALRRRDRAA